MRQKIFYFVILITYSSTCSFAQGSTKIGKYAGEFLAIGVGGRALGMGGAYAATGGDVTSAYWNPAGLMRMNYPELALMHDERFGNLINYDYGGAAIPFGSKYTLGISLMRLGIDDIKDTRNALIDENGNGTMDPNERLDESKIKAFSTTDWALYLSYAFQVNKFLSLGANLKLIRRDLGDNSATGVGFDVGALVMVTPNFYFGANVQDITTTLLAWDTGTNELISPTAKIGAAYVIEAFGGKFTPALDFDVMFENRKFASVASLGPVGINPRAGLEYEFKNLIAVRAGYTDTKSLTFGAGVHLPKLNLDYSFAKFDGTNQIGENTHRISLRVTIEEKQFQRQPR